MAKIELIDRDTYKKIKKMDREKLTKFILQYGDQLVAQEEKTIELPALEAEPPQTPYEQSKSAINIRFCYNKGNSYSQFSESSYF